MYGQVHVHAMEKNRSTSCSMRLVMMYAVSIMQCGAMHSKLDMSRITNLLIRIAKGGRIQFA